MVPNNRDVESQKADLTRGGIETLGYVDVLHQVTVKSESRPNQRWD